MIILIGVNYYCRFDQYNYIVIYIIVIRSISCISS